MIEKKDVCILILTFGRSENQKTDKMLDAMQSEIDRYFVVSADDGELQNYKKKYGEKVIVFDKSDYRLCEIDNFDDIGSVVYARNASFDIVGSLGYKYFLMLDDDYRTIELRIDKKYKYIRYSPIRKKIIDEIFLEIFKFLEKSGADCVAMAQAGDFLGGKECGYARDLKLRRKVMNSFFLKANSDLRFVGKYNDDVNTYCLKGLRGKKLFTIPYLVVVQTITQGAKGGLTESYLKHGTYHKSLSTVMLCPSFVRVSCMGNKHKRIHHKIGWGNACPKILKKKSV